MRIAILALLPAVAALTLVPRAAAAQDEFHWKGKVAPGKAIEIKGVNGDVRAVAGSGDVEAANLASDVQANTVNGSIRISTSGYAEAQTVNGSIVASMGRATWTEALDFRTVNGAITLDLPANVSTEVRASTVNGDIVTDFPIMVRGRLGPRSLRGTIGSGGRRLALETVNGSIRLRKAS